MSKSGLWVALALLALVGGGIGYLLYQDSKGPAEAPPSEARMFPSGLKELAGIRLERPGETPFSLVEAGMRTGGLTLRLLMRRIR